MQELFLTGYFRKSCLVLRNGRIDAVIGQNNALGSTGRTGRVYHNDRHVLLIRSFCFRRIGITFAYELTPEAILNIEFKLVIQFFIRAVF